MQFTNTEVQPWCFGGVCTSTCVPPVCLYILQWCLLRFPHKNDVQFVFTSSCLQEGSCLIYVICGCLCIVVSNMYCVVFSLCLSCVPYVAGFSGLSIFYSLTFTQHYVNSSVSQALFGLKKLGNQEDFQLKIRRLSGFFLHKK